MKKNIIKSLTCILFVAIVASCSSDNGAKEDPSARENFSAKSGDSWEGRIIGVERNGEYVITADANALTAYLENILEKEGEPAQIQTLEIQLKTASNNPDSKGFMLIGSSNMGDMSASIGIMLSKNGGNLYFSQNINGDPRTSTSCRGCAEGCNLMYYDINGKKVPYCQENGCPTNNCKKTETTL